MPQSAIATSSPPDSGFTPRKEFIREQKLEINSFALLAIAGSNFIRLYSFPSHVVTAFRRLFEQQRILNVFREDVNQNLCEFSLDGKPWAASKSVATEKLLIDIFAIIYRCGYEYLSTLDYGREHDDRLAMAFSRPTGLLPGSRSGTPLPTTPLPDSSASVSSDKPKIRRIPFALSFSSATLMRVIAPPLHLTPAILQAVRGSWPRGVVSEKKVGDNSFEFKLKGYRWFQQDTFATDSLRHILSLLSSLDAQSFTLLSSISLTNRSRVKDLWVFTGPASSSTDDLSFPDTPSTSIHHSFHGEFKRQVRGSDPPLYHQKNVAQGSLSQHRRFATGPNAPLSHSPPSQHARAATDDDHNAHLRNDQRMVVTSVSLPPNTASPSALLRKPAPRAQVPVSVIHEAEALSSEGLRTNLPSTISTDVENMTGVGATGFSPDVLYTASPFNGIRSSGGPTSPSSPIPVHATPVPRSVTPPDRARSPLRPVSSRAKTPPLLVSHPPSPSLPSARNPPTPPEQYSDLTARPSPGVALASSQPSISGTPPLLGPGAFRDSAFSSKSEASYEIPIKWTSLGEVLDQNSDQHPNRMTKLTSPTDNRVSSVGPVLPGGWQPTPIEEKLEEDGGVINDKLSEKDRGRGPETPVHDVGSRVASPELYEPDVRTRKSETALIGMIENTLPPPPMPEQDKGRRKESQGSGGGQGWVLVNIEATSSPVDTTQGASGEARVISRSPEPLSPTSPTSNDAKSAEPFKQPNSLQASVSPTAKAIVIIDAVDKSNKNKFKSSQGGVNDSPMKKRFFGLGRKPSKKAPSQLGNDSTTMEDKGPTNVKSRSGFRDKLRLMGTPEAPRNEDKRRSID